MSTDSGRQLGGIGHLRQSVRNILTTPIGSRVMRRDYGSRVPDLIDGPMGPAQVQRVIAACADALLRWEPRLRLHRLQIAAGEPESGRVELDLEGEYWPDGIPDNAQQIRLQGVAL